MNIERVALVEIWIVLVKCAQLSGPKTVVYIYYWSSPFILETV